MEGHDYTFRVSAENELGVGEPCQSDVPTRAKGAMGTFAHLRFLAKLTKTVCPFYIQLHIGFPLWFSFVVTITLQLFCLI